MVTTGPDGRAQWTYPVPLDAAPVIGALPVMESSGWPLTVVLEEITAASVTVRVWRARPLLGLGLLPAVPVGAGVAVHLTAVPPAWRE